MANLVVVVLPNMLQSWHPHYSKRRIGDKLTHVIFKIADKEFDEHMGLYPALYKVRLPRPHIEAYT